MKKLNKTALLLAVSLTALLVAVSLAALLVAGCSDGQAPTTKSDDIVKSRYVQAFSDPDNGCEYFTTTDGGMYPRLNRDGSQRGCN